MKVYVLEFWDGRPAENIYRSVVVNSEALAVKTAFEIVGEIQWLNARVIEYDDECWPMSDDDVIVSYSWVDGWRNSR